MDFNELKDSIRNLVDVIKDLPGGISSVISGGPGSPARSTAGTVVGAAAGNSYDVLAKVFPNVRRFGDALGKLTDNLVQSNRLMKTARELGSTSPLGARGLDAIQKSVMNRFVSRENREKVLDQVATARKDYSTYQSLLKRSDQDKSSYKEAREAYKESADKHKAAVANRARLKKNADRASRARAIAWNQYQTTLGMHMRYPGNSSPWATHLRAERRRFEQADRLARRLIRKSRMAGRDVRNAYSARSAAARAARAAGAGARSSAGAAAAAGGKARSSAAAASASAAAANSAGAATALVGVAAKAFGVMQAFAALSKSAYDMSSRMSEFADDTLHKNRASAAFAPKLAAALNSLSIHDLQRRMSFASGTEDSAVKLAKAVDELREAQLQGAIGQQNVQNTFANIAAKMATPFEAEKSRMWSEIDRFASGVFGGEGAESAAEAFGTAAASILITPIANGFKMVSDALGFKQQGDKWVGTGGPADNFVERMATEHARNMGPIRKDKRDGLGDRWNPLKKP